MQLWRGTLGVQASGLVLGLLEAEDGTARHRTSQPGEISRPSSRQKHWDPLQPGIQTGLLPHSCRVLFQARSSGFFQAKTLGSLYSLGSTSSSKQSSIQGQDLQAFFQAKIFGFLFSLESRYSSRHYSRPGWHKLRGILKA